MVSLEKIKDLVGYLVLTEDGAVLESGGDLKNDEQSANVVHDLINLTDTVDPKVFDKNECQRISVIFEHHSYTICQSNKKVYVVKRLNNQLNPNSQQTHAVPKVSFQSNQSTDGEPSTSSNLEIA